MIRCENPILIGGCGSSGSTLLQAVLNRHSAIAAGPELFLFNKPRFYCRDWSTLQRRSRRFVYGRTCTGGWPLHTRTLLALEAYGWTRAGVLQLLRDSCCRRDFVDSFFEPSLLHQGKRVWVEKTSSNCYCFGSFLRAFPGGRVVHVHRDGRDVLASLRRRGLDSYSGAMRWLSDTAAALAWSEHPRYFSVRYEELVTAPEKTVRTLCTTLGLDFEETMLEPQEADTAFQHAGWSNAPRGPISTSSIGKYRRQLTTVDWAAFRSVRLRRRFREGHGILVDNTNEVLRVLGYPVEEWAAPRRSCMACRVPLLAQQIKDYVRRTAANAVVDLRIRPYPGRLV